MWFLLEGEVLRAEGLVIIFLNSWRKYWEIFGTNVQILLQYREKNVSIIGTSASEHIHSVQFVCHRSEKIGSTRDSICRSHYVAPFA